jgi:uncharacterized protein (DUF2141 family)
MNGTLTPAVALLSILLSLPAPQQPARDRSDRPAAGVLAGRVVVNDASAQPVRRAFVELRGGTLSAPLLTTTGDDGTFAFAGLAAGRYTVEAWRNGFVRDAYGSRRPGSGTGTTVVVGGGDRESIVVRLTRSAVITGRVTGDTGGVAGLLVVAARVQTIAGERRFAPGVVMSTDDRGVYRIYGLAPGEYVVALGPKGVGPYRTITRDEVAWATRPSGVSAPPAATPALASAPVYYTSTFEPAAAASFMVAAGPERASVDILSMMAPPTRVDGIFVGPQGEPILTGEARISSGALSLMQTMTTIRLTPEGRFLSTIAMPGRYTIQAHGTVRPPQGPDRPSLTVPDAAEADLWGTLDIEAAGQDLTGLVVPMLPGARLSGGVRVDGRALTVDERAHLRISVRSASPNPLIAAGSARSVSVRDDGTFTIGGIAPGRWLIGVSGGRLKSIAIGGRDVADIPFDVRAGQTIADVTVTLTERTQELTGRLIDPAGRPAPDYFIVAFPVDPALWGAAVRRTAHVRPDSSGRFTFTTLPAGDYFVCALEDLDPVELEDAALFQQLVPASARVTLRDGQRTIQDLQIARERVLR